MKVTKKILAVILAVTMAATAAACSSTPTPAASTGAASAAASQAGKKTITIWAWDVEYNIPVMKEAKARYEAAHKDVEVNVVEYAYDDIIQKLNTSLASGVTDTLPDIVLVEDANVQKNLRSFPGAFYDMTKVVDYKNFADYKVKLLTMDDKVYGMPFDTGTEGLFYRTDYLQQAGYSAKDLENITWSQFIEIGKKVKEKTGKYMMTLDPNSMTIMRDFMQSAGTWYFDADGKINMVNNAALNEGINVYKKLINSGIVKLTTGWGEMVSALNKGDVASITTGCWIVPSITAEETQSGKWAVAHMPKLEVTGGTNYGNRGGSCWLVLKDAANSETAADFLNKTFGSDTDFYQTILKDIGAIGTYLPAVKGDEYNKEQKFFGGQKIYSQFSEWSGHVPSINMGIYSDEADTLLATAINKIVKENADIKTTLQSVESQLKQQIQ